MTEVDPNDPFKGLRTIPDPMWPGLVATAVIVLLLGLALLLL